jgi:ABC-type uncharacterized transport system permease subunit
MPEPIHDPDRLNSRGRWWLAIAAFILAFWTLLLNLMAAALG